jgi:Xaa-Pro aminopeptidase
MKDEMRARMRAFQERLRAARHQVAVLSEPSSIAYLAGCFGYLGVEFGRPTLLVVRPDTEPVLITPAMEAELVGRMTWIEDVRPWEDAGPAHWTARLAQTLDRDVRALGVEADVLPALVRRGLEETFAGVPLIDAAPALAELRMIKSPAEILVMRQAGSIAEAMMAAARDALHEGVPEYEVALGVRAAGTRKAASLLNGAGWDALVSPVIHGLPILQSGPDTSMVHRRAGCRRIGRGEPVYFCFCNLVEFKHYRLGFDRLLFVGEPDADARRVQEIAIEAQAAALQAVRPGVLAEQVATAANEVYARYGLAPGYRTGRAIGLAYLEAPELKAGDRTVLRPGMTFAVDGGVTVPGRLGGRIGDSIVVTEAGFDFLTDFPRSVLVV